MPALRDLQRAFLSALLRDGGQAMDELILENGLDVESRLRIYANNSRIAFIDTLKATFPVIQCLGGAPWFLQQARRYRHCFPSHSGDLQFVGARFAEFLESELAATPYEYFVDVARLEWAYQEVLIAAEGVPLTPRALAGLAREDYSGLRLSAMPALRLIESPFPILSIWQSHQSSTNDAPTVDLQSGAERVLLIRRADHVELQSLPIDTAGLLSAFIRGATLGHAVEALLAHRPEFDLTASLKQLFSLAALGGSVPLPPSDSLAQPATRRSP
jgi:hypothetical protein